MRLKPIHKIQTALSAFGHRGELKDILIRRYWQRRKHLEIRVGEVTATFDTSDFLSNTILWGSEFPEDYEPAVSRLLVTLIKNSRVYADIGGNVGVFSVLPAIANPDCKIFYFEMDRTIKPLLLRNMRLNHLGDTSITIVNAAAGELDGQLEYLPHPYSFLAMLGKERIDIYDLKCHAPVITLDSYFRSQGFDPDLMKIDIDGAEFSALRGMSRILREAKPDLLLEVHPAYLPKFGSSAAEVFALLNRFDYQVFSITDFRRSTVPHLEQIFDFNSLATPTGDMIFATTGQRYKIVDGTIRVQYPADRLDPKKER